VGLKVGLDIIEMPGYDPGILQPIVSHYNDYATLATHSELKGKGKVIPLQARLWPTGWVQV